MKIRSKLNDHSSLLLKLTSKGEYVIIDEYYDASKSFQANRNHAYLLGNERL